MVCQVWSLIWEDPHIPQSNQAAHHNPKATCLEPMLCSKRKRSNEKPARCIYRAASTCRNQKACAQLTKINTPKTKFSKYLNFKKNLGIIMNTRQRQRTAYWEWEKKLQQIADIMKNEVLFFWGMLIRKWFLIVTLPLLTTRELSTSPGNNKSSKEGCSGWRALITYI